MKKWVGAAVALSVVGGVAMAQQVEPLPPECRRMVWESCHAAGRMGIRECVRRAMPTLSDLCRKAISDRPAARDPLPAGMTEIAYGRDPLQRLDLITPAGNKRPPVVLFIHGGGWSIGDKRGTAASKAEHFTANGYAFASVNYRLVPGATVEGQAADIASAIAFLRTNAMGSNYDGDRIVLMGHSAGAHLAALVCTDPRYLAAAGVPMRTVKGVILLDGAGYDIAKQMAQPNNPVAGMYDAAFGRDIARQKTLSPTLHAAAPNVADWLILPVASRTDSTAQSTALASALIAAGARARVTPVPDSSHRRLNHGLGSDGDFATEEVDKFLVRLR
jgi:acetyl esterase/lipase